MKDAENIISSCRHCLFYEGQGRRGGQCRQLGVPVKGCWKSCSLAVSPFAPSWQGLERIVVTLHSPDFDSAIEILQGQPEEQFQTIEIAQ